MSSLRARGIFIALLALSLSIPGIATAQVGLANVPPNSVIGRQGIPVQGGPAQAIPFAALVQNLMSSFPPCGANTVFAGPSSGSPATPSCRSLVLGDIPAFTIPTTTFATRTAAAAATIASSVSSLYVGGYASLGDGGDGTYIRLVSPPSPAKAWHFQSYDGAWWQLRTNPVLPKQLGAALNNSIDDAVPLQAWLDYAYQFKATAGGQTGIGLVSTAKLSINSGVVVDCFKQMTIRRTTNIVDSLLEATDKTGVIVRNCTVDTLAGMTSVSTNTIGLTTQTYTIGAGVNLVLNQFVVISAAANPTNYMIARINSYSGTTLNVTGTTAVGSGTFSSWNIDVYPYSGGFPNNVGIRLIRCVTCNIDGNTVSGRFYNGVEAWDSYNVIISGNTVIGPVNRSIVYQIENFQGIGGKIVNNTIIGNGFTQYGINTAASNAGNALKIIVANNQIDGVNFQGIEVGGAVAKAVVTGNVIRLTYTTNGAGVLVQQYLSNSPSGWVVSNNAITGGQYGVAVINAFYGTIAANNVESSYYGVFAQQTTGNFTGYLQVSNNNVHASVSNAFHFTGGSATGVSGVNLTGNSALSNGGWGFFSDANCDRITAVANQAAANTSGGYSLGGTGVVTSGNI